jgi:hypothetical protein
MGMRLIAIGNVIVMQYVITSHYKVPYKWAWLVLTASVLSALLVLTKKGNG